MYEGRTPDYGLQFYSDLWGHHGRLTIVLKLAPSGERLQNGSSPFAGCPFNRLHTKLHIGDIITKRYNSGDSWGMMSIISS